MTANIFIDSPQVPVYRTNAAGISPGFQFPENPCSVKTVGLAPPGNDLLLERIDFGMILGALICGSFCHFQQLSHRVA